MNTPKKNRFIRPTIEDGQPANGTQFTFIPGFYFSAIQDYAHGILKELNKRILFEYLLFQGEWRLQKGDVRFWHSYATIQKRTTISPNVALSIVREFVKEGFLTCEVGTVAGRKITFFTIHFAHLATRMATLYGGLDVNHTPEQLTRIAQRKRALQQLAKRQVRLKQQRRALFAQS
jgi:hypothetical protein